MAKGTYSAFKQDEAREKTGVVLDLGDAGKFKVARAGGSNTQFNKRLDAVTKPFRRAIQTDNMDEKLAEKLIVEVFVETVLLGWEGVTGPTGDMLEYTTENAIKLFTDLPELFKEIRVIAADGTLFRAEVREADVKN